MRPDPSDETPLRDSHEVLPRVLARAAVHRRRLTRRRRGERALVPMIAVLLLVGSLALRRDDDVADAVLDTTAPTATTSTTTVAPPTEAGPGTGPGDELDLLPGTVPIPVPVPVPGSSTTAPTAETPTTLSSSVAVAFDQRTYNGRHRAVLLPAGGTTLIGLSDPTVERQVPQLSPDGRSVVYQSEVGNVMVGLHTITEIYTRDLASGEVRQLTSDPLDSGHGSQWPSWSPDGRRLAFNCPTPQGHPICIANRDGGDRRAVTDPALELYAPAWAPDGRHLVALKSPDGGRTHTLWIIDTTSGTAKRLDATLSNADFPTFSRDGASILLSANLSLEEHQVLRIDLSTGEVEELLRLPAAWVVVCDTGELVFYAAGPWKTAQRGDIVLTDAGARSHRVLYEGDAGSSLEPTSCRGVTRG